MFIRADGIRALFKVSRCLLFQNKKNFSFSHVLSTVGLTKYAENKIGDVVYVGLPSVGDIVNLGGILFFEIILDECGEVESVKAVVEVYSPVSGKIVETNNKLEKSPELINNSSLLESGWLFKVELSNDAQLNDLMSEKQYDEYIKSEA